MAEEEKQPRQPVTCLRCGWIWTPRVDNPRWCPKCNSPYWNKPRQRDSMPKARSQTRDVEMAAADGA